MGCPGGHAAAPAGLNVSSWSKPAVCRIIAERLGEGVASDAGAKSAMVRAWLGCTHVKPNVSALLGFVPSAQPAGAGGDSSPQPGLKAKCIGIFSKELGRPQKRNFINEQSLFAGQCPELKRPRDVRLYRDWPARVGWAERV